MHILELESDEEYAEIIAALSRIKDSPHSAGFQMYCRLWEETPVKIKAMANEIRMSLQFSNKPRI